MIGIHITILLALLEYAVVLAFIRKTKKKQLAPEDSSSDKKEMLEKLDQLAMICSAAFFIIFNICYWIAASLNQSYVTRKVTLKLVRSESDSIKRSIYITQPMEAEINR